ncbi:MAG TPA: Wss1p-related putative metallopeptidase [Myxococcota bacterium]|nr:Wss1p-related putative metallopeptidase [Myxococcota bacterium]
MDRETVRALVERLNRDAAQIAACFGLAYHSIEAERPRVRRRYGVCYADGRIRIRLRHNATGEPLKYSSLVNTLCHELAHLKHFNHGERFKAFYLRLLEYARREGIYQPSRRAPGRPDPRSLRGAAARLHRPSHPEQLTLFG